MRLRHSSAKTDDAHYSALRPTRPFSHQPFNFQRVSMYESKFWPQMKRRTKSIERDDSPVALDAFCALPCLLLRPRSVFFETLPDEPFGQIGDDFPGNLTHDLL